MNVMSRLVAALCVLASVAVHAAAALMAPPAEPPKVDGAAGAAQAQLGSSFADLARGVQAATPPDHAAPQPEVETAQPAPSPAARAVEAVDEVTPTETGASGGACPPDRGPRHAEGQRPGRGLAHRGPPGLARADGGGGGRGGHRHRARQARPGRGQRTARNRRRYARHGPAGETLAPLRAAGRAGRRGRGAGFRRAPRPARNTSPN